MAEQRHSRQRTLENPEIEKLKERLRHHRDQLKRLHRKGTGGLELVRRNAEFYDEIIRSLFRKAVQDYSGTEIPLAVAAVGGYGSKLLAPYSDIDLLFLVGEGSDPETARSLIEATLYPLWDMKLEVGHATRAVSDQAYLLLHDPAVLTASLDARFLAGDRSTFDELLHLMNAYIDSGRIKPRIPRKTEPGMEDYPIASVTVLEPNVKESPGGLRDLQALDWALQVQSGCADPGAVAGR